MKAIVDTCVWSLSLRRRNQARLNAQEQKMLVELGEAIRDRRAAIIGPIRQEVLSGIRDKAWFAKTAELLDPFLDEEITSKDYVEAARLFNLCRNHGVECGPVDILICSVAVGHGFGVLTTDKGLIRCVEALRAEGFNL
ncbi:MAG: PIN domain-containing protein [Terracidiphilus sp.]|jgi:predicted nucleic acid-binding protein